MTPRTRRTSRKMPLAASSGNSGTLGSGSSTGSPAGRKQGVFTRGLGPPSSPDPGPGLTPRRPQWVGEVKALHRRQRSQIVCRALSVRETVVILGRLQAQTVVNLQHHYRAAETQGRGRRLSGRGYKPRPRPRPPPHAALLGASLLTRSPLTPIRHPIPPHPLRLPVFKSTYYIFGDIEDVYFFFAVVMVLQCF